MDMHLMLKGLRMRSVNKQWYWCQETNPSIHSSLSKTKVFCFPLNSHTLQIITLLQCFHKLRVRGQ